MQKIKKFFVVLLLIFSCSFNTVFANTVSSKISNLVADGYTVVAVVTGNYWMISGYDTDSGRHIMEIVEEF